MNCDLKYEKQKRDAEGMRTAWKMSDRLRDTGLTDPESVTRIDNIVYGPYGHFNLLDYYRPKDTEGQVLPLIISIHGGGWVYGDKELYQYYCLSLAERGFAVINFNYRLAPEDPFPAALQDIRRLLTWTAQNGERYGFDPKKIFLVGDSAGAHLASWTATMLTSPAYRALYEKNFPLAKGTSRLDAVPFSRDQYQSVGVPENLLEGMPEENYEPDETARWALPAEDIRILGCGLNCGIYDMKNAVNGSLDELFTTFLDSVYENTPDLALDLVDSWGYMTADFPPAFVMSAANDFLLPMAQPMAEHLQSLGCHAELHVYGSKDQEYMGHVFHINQYLKEADQCNDDETAFFRTLL